MSRNTPIPVVDIAANIITDCESGENLANIIIDVQVGGYSNGILVLDEPGDLYILRNAIDDYINRYKIQKPTPMSMNENDIKEPGKPTDENKPEFLGVIEGFINTQYRPTRGFNPDDRRNFRVMTSQEIVLDLADMVDIGLNDVAEAMMYLGYRTIIHDGKVGWLLQRRGD